MDALSPDECRAFASTGTRTAKLALVRRDGRPLVAPVWFVFDGEDLVFMTHADSLKGRILARDPRVMLSIDEEAFPYGFVAIEGQAELEVVTPDELRPWSRRIAERYVPPALAEKTTERNAVEGERLVRVRVEKIRGMRGVAD